MKRWVFHTFFFHTSSETFVESAETTLVPLIFVHNALSAEPAHDERVTMSAVVQSRTHEGTVNDSVEIGDWILDLYCRYDNNVKLPAGVDVTFAYGASKEAFTAITAGGPVVFPSGFVSTDRTVAAHSFWTNQAWLCGHAAVWIT